MKPPKHQAEEIAARPHVQRWLRRFRSVVAAMPPEVQVFVAVDTPVVMALDENGNAYVTAAGHEDPCAEIESIEGGRWACGDF